jgi:tRNA/tmRNA/rRNA uracil-C5-methylase (TrmA/RlmC/RlmD family)
MSELEITIHDVAFGGAGVGRLPDGKVVFVRYTLAGETVRVRLSKSKKGFSEAELIEVIKPSPHRTNPPCVYFGHCGGCQYQHATYEEQLRIKEKQVRDTLERIGGLKDLPNIHVVSAPQPFGYRNKITVHRGETGEVGFFMNDGRSIIDVEKCVIANDQVNQQLSLLRKSQVRKSHMSISDPSERIGSPEGSFHQINASMAEQLLQWLLPVAKADEGSSRLIDLYCGAGFFALGLAGQFSEISGLDRDAHAIHAANLRAKSLGITHVQFFAAPVEERLEWLLNGLDFQKATILVDPPREGLPKPVVETLCTSKPARLIYVSCNPATLARDLKSLAASGYSFVKLGIFDMFPQTAHIEAVVVLKSNT